MMLQLGTEYKEEMRKLSLAEMAFSRFHQFHWLRNVRYRTVFHLPFCDQVVFILHAKFKVQEMPLLQVVVTVYTV